MSCQEKYTDIYFIGEKSRKLNEKTKVSSLKLYMQNVGLKIQSLHSWRWIKANKGDIPEWNSTFVIKEGLTINETLVNMTFF